MSWEFPPIDKDTDLVELIRRMNDKFKELSDYLKARDEGQVYEAPKAPFDGYTVYTYDVGWQPGGGSGMYTFANERWTKLGAGRSFPRQVQFKNILSTYPVVPTVYNMLFTDITTPVTILRANYAIGSYTINLYLGAGLVDGMEVGCYNRSTDAMTVTYGGGKQIVLQTGEGCCFVYVTALGGWLINL